MENWPLATEALRAARRIVVFTGAGVSAESGIPTYRSGDTALWSTGHFERFANPRGYRKHLPESYHWYRARAASVAAAQPNPGHHAIARLATLKPGTAVITQNVDGLHVRAGSAEVLELHGHLRTARCAGCWREVPWDAAPPDPVCDCGGMLRPNVVMFEEMLDERTLRAARDAASRCDLLVSVGTSNQVWPASELPALTHASGGTVVIVNPDLDGQPRGDRVIRLAGRAGEILPRLVDALASSLSRAES